MTFSSGTPYWTLQASIIQLKIFSLLSSEDDIQMCTVSGDKDRNWFVNRGQRKNTYIQSILSRKLNDGFPRNRKFENTRHICEVAEQHPSHHSKERVHISQYLLEGVYIT